MKTLQERLEPNIFSPKGVYDGRKNLFTTKRLPFGDSDSRTVCFVLRIAKIMASNLELSLRCPWETRVRTAIALRALEG
jgi:hypothetical protein